MTTERDFWIALVQDAMAEMRRALVQVPGVMQIKHGRRLTVRWSWTDAIKGAGL